MPLATQNYGRVWKSSRFLPFLSNIVIERMACDSYGFAVDDYFRVLVNRDAQPLSCADGPADSCSKSAFQDFIRERSVLFGSYTEQCQPDYTNSTDFLTLYS
jgi:acid phosphatase